MDTTCVHAVLKAHHKENLFFATPIMYDGFFCGKINYEKALFCLKIMQMREFFLLLESKSHQHEAKATSNDTNTLTEVIYLAFHMLILV